MKMYIWDESTSSKELLYDFDVNVGEEFIVAPSINNWLEPLIVQDIDYISLGGIERKIITFENWSYPESIFIEGIGHWRGIWYANDVYLGYEYLLVCFSLNGESYFVNTEESHLLRPSEENCEFVVGLPEITNRSINIYPNPTKDNLSIKSEFPMTSIEISDLAGRIVYQSKINANHINLNVDFLSTGYYHVHTTMDSHSTVTLQMLKE
jgi:hypothetical protein